MKNGPHHHNLLFAGAAFLLSSGLAVAHEVTLPAMRLYLAQFAQARAAAEAEAPTERPCVLSLHLRMADSTKPISGLVRITPLGANATPVFLLELFQRPAGWFSAPANATVRLPRGRFRVEAVHGTETAIATREIDLTKSSSLDLSVSLTRIYDPSARHLYSGNTHLHLETNDPSITTGMGVMLRDRKDADGYLQTVGHSDGLDLVYVSYLTQRAENFKPGQSYASNEYTAADLARFSIGPTLFGSGIEHRHRGVRNADGSRSMTYGHVMILGVARDAIPASIGPGQTDPDATDGVPLRQGIVEARQLGATAIWCHGSFGLEDIPDWIAGVIHAQNIYDGGDIFNIDAVYYPYLNIGLKVPFSTGTDWGYWDFSRVYVLLAAHVTSRSFLQELEAGRSYITNEPFLEFTAGGASIGDTINLEKPGSVNVRGRAVGRSEFLRLQVVYNGQVIKEAPSRSVNGHFEAELDFTATADRSGWLALRIPSEKNYDIRSRYSGPGTNILGKAIFAHTSPIYLTVAGQPTFDEQSLDNLLLQVRAARKWINEVGKFATSDERARILRIYSDAESAMTRLLETKGRR